ncbi:2TM domain-containing protein [Flavobacterium aquidurense]|uniref:2TM superfamily protein n=1 Tax=Flavobacterium aquidurense TaxID=362413 RepID=A0A0Q0WTI4_9FLAO|nr:2TM domain-containing protein [Flavobacterium aquidurense]KQB39317.1 2TM superfamily protein [Flavobacterium aquidurense]
MGRFRQRMYEDYRHEFSTDESYNVAYRKVKKIKGFYSHLKIYILVNIIIIVSSLNRDYLGSHFYAGNNFEVRGFRDWEIYSTAFYWGIGLLIHAFTVFGPNIFFSNDWEQKKIQKYMDKDAQNKNKWE